VTTLPELLEQRPKMRYIFTGGKGGVGKTVAAAGLAYHYASQGENVLVASLNPVHSLSSLFGQSLSGGKVIEVKGAKNCTRSRWRRPRSWSATAIRSEVG